LQFWWGEATDEPVLVRSGSRGRSPHQPAKIVGLPFPIENQAFAQNRLFCLLRQDRWFQTGTLDDIHKIEKQL
jgi:hypothetical protein